MRRIALPLGLCLLFAGSVSARDPSFNTQVFKPSADTGNYLGVYGSQVLPRGKFSLGFTADYAHEPVILENAAGAKIRNIIGREIGGHLHGSFGILDWWDVGLLVSTASYLQFFTSATASETRIRMGDLLLTSRLRLVDNEKAPVGLTFMPMVSFPTGQGASLVGNNRFAGGGMLIFDTKRAGDRFSLALNAGYELRESVALSTGTTVNDLVLYGLGANLALLPNLDLIGEIRGFTLAGDLFGAQLRPIEGSGAVRIYVSPHWAMTVGGGSGLITGLGTPVFRALAGLSYIPEHKGFERKPKVKKEKITDTDGDGVNDDLDRCPTEVGVPENGGCPPEPKVVITPEEYRILTRPIQFDFEKASLRPDALPILQTLLEAMKAKPSIRRISIEGHCDERGTEKFNQWLSEERARSVRGYLVDNGIEGERLEMEGFGESRPVDPAHHREAWIQNRRVEFVFKEVEEMEIPSPVPPSLEPVLPEAGPVIVPPVTPAAPTGMPPITPSEVPSPENSQTGGELETPPPADSESPPEDRPASFPSPEPSPPQSPPEP